MANKKVNINDILDVYNNHWPSDDWCLEDACGGWEDESYGGPIRYTDKGAEAVNPGEMVTLSHFDAYIAWQGNGKEPKRDFPTSFVKLFHKVMSEKTHVTLAVQVPKEKVEEFKKLATEMGAKL